MNKVTRNVIVTVVAFAILIVLLTSLYVVRETNQVIITQFGEPKGDAITKPGLHMKVPFIQIANKFEKRWLEWDGDANQIPTRQKIHLG
jgi:membrane protease subunit HflC